MSDIEIAKEIVMYINEEYELNIKFNEIKKYAIGRHEIQYILPLFYFDTEFLEKKVEVDISLVINLKDKKKKIEMEIFPIVVFKHEALESYKISLHKTFKIDIMISKDIKLDLKSKKSLLKFMLHLKDEETQKEIEYMIKNELKDIFREDGILSGTKAKFEVTQEYTPDTKKVIIYSKRLTTRAENLFRQNRQYLMNYYNRKEDSFSMFIDTWAYSKEGVDQPAKIIKILENFYPDYNFSIYKDNEGIFDPYKNPYVWEDLEILTKKLMEEVSNKSPSSGIEFYTMHTSIGDYGVFAKVKKSTINKFIGY